MEVPISTVPYPILSLTVGLITVTVLVMFMLRNRPKNDIRVALALIVVIAFIGITAWAALHPIPESEVGGLLLGALISGFTIIVGWFFNDQTKGD